MKLTTHMLALITIFSVVSLIGCKDNSNQQVTAAQCMGTAGCPQGVAQALGLTPGQQALAFGSLCPLGTVSGPTGCTQQLAGAAPPATAPLLPPPTGTAVAQAPPVATIPPGTIAHMAAQIQRGLAEASANPMSSYYVDPNADDVPARNSQESVNTVPAQAAAQRGPASADDSGSGTTTR